MAVTPNVINKIKKVEYSTLEPTDRGVLWAEPTGEGEYTCRVYDNGRWNVVSSGGGGIPTNISYFYNDVGYITMEDLPSDLYEIPETGIPKTDLSQAVQTSLNKADTALQEHQDISGKANISDLAEVATTGSYNDLTDKPTIPSQVTESTVAGWGFTKNTGTYNKPSTGIPPADLASSVQTSLGKADTALQSYTETDPVFAASVAHGITSSDITNWNSKTSNIGTITGITMNGASKGTSGVVDLGTVITAHQDISGKEDKMGIITVSATSLTSSVNKYYRFTADVGTLTVTLPTVTDTTKVASIVFYLTTGSSPAVTFTSSHSVVYQEGFQLDASKTYEINCLFNGAAWVLMAAEINTSL